MLQRSWVEGASGKHPSGVAGSRFLATRARARTSRPAYSGLVGGLGGSRDVTGLYGIGEGARCACGSGRAPTQACMHPSHVDPCSCSEGRGADGAGGSLRSSLAEAMGMPLTRLPSARPPSGRWEPRIEMHARRPGPCQWGPASGSEHDAANLKPPSPQPPWRMLGG